MERIKILDVLIDNLTMQETVDIVRQYIDRKEPLHLVGVNADKINTLHKDKKLKEIVGHCGVVNADGVSVVWASKKLKRPIKERVAGIDLMEKLLELAEKEQYEVYFLGARQPVTEKCVKNVKKVYPELPVAGYRNGYFGRDEWSRIANEIETSGAKIVFVGITSPMKEYLIDYFQSRGMTAVFMGVGGSFDVLAGDIPRAPEWIQKMGMEWMFRMMQEPKRLMKRYLLGNCEFIFRVYRAKFGKD